MEAGKGGGRLGIKKKKKLEYLNSVPVSYLSPSFLSELTSIVN